nr:hypothetical protein [Micromonospora sp. DSM 115978]
MSDVRVIVQRTQERDERMVPTGTTAAEVFVGERTVVAARIGGKERDLAHVLADGDVVEPVTNDSPAGRA